MDLRQKVLSTYASVAIFLMAISSILAAEQSTTQDDDLIQTNKVMVVSYQSAGKVSKTGLGFLYDPNTVVCSYSDVKGASQIQIQWEGSGAVIKRLIAFHESMDLAVLGTDEELPVLTPLSVSSTLAAGDRVSYWIEREGWQLVHGDVHEIMDTGKGYDLILIESRNYSSRSTPLYNSEGLIVGWLQGKRAIPMQTIATFAENKSSEMQITEVSSMDASWNFVKPSGKAGGSLSFSSEMKTVAGPAEFPFELELPGDLEGRVLNSSGKFHARYDRAPISVEIRAVPMGDQDIFAAMEHAESLVFADFLRSDMIPYSADYLTGFRASYEDNDAVNPYFLQVFFSSSSGKLYVVSVCYPKKLEEQMESLVEQIFSSFRF